MDRAARRRMVAAIAVVAAVAGCSGPGSSSCTLIGCVDQVSVRFVSPRALPYTVAIGYDQSMGQFTCGGEGVRDRTGGVVVVGCDDSGFTVGAAPVALDVQLDPPQVVLGGDGGGSDAGASPGGRSAHLVPTYTSTTPNGPSCPPICRQSTISF